MFRKYQKFAEQYLDITNISGSECMAKCIVHDDSKASLQFNLDTGLWVCFACQEGGSIGKLMRELGIETFSEPEPDIDDIRRKVRALSKPAATGPEPVAETYLSRFMFPTKYWLGRGFTDKTIDAFDLGYDPIENAATIPMRNERGQLLGVTRRFLDDDVDLRYQYPFRFKRSQNLFGSWLAEHHHSDLAVLTEGAVDAMKVWQAGYIGLAQYGSSISASQIRVLRRLGIRRVVLFYDDDKAGKKATLCAQGKKSHARKGRMIYEYDPSIDLRRDFLVASVTYQQGAFSDPGSMTTRMIKSHVDQATKVS